MRAAFEAFQVQPRDGQGAEDVRRELTDMRRLIDELELEFSGTAAELAAFGEDEWEGSNSPNEWIKEECKTSGTKAWNAIVVGEQASALQASTRALRDGEIGFAHLSLIAETARWVQESGASEDFDEGFLLRRARERSLAQLRRDCAHLRHAADPRRFLREQVAQVEARFLELRTTEGGGLWLRGFLDAEGGGTLRSALEPLARPLPEEERTRERRLADGLVELSGRALDSGSLPRHAGQRPHLQVTVSLETLTGTPGSPAAEIEGGGSIAAETARRLGCDAQIRRVVFGPESAVLDVGRAARIPQAATRLAVIARDRACVWPGCGRPASWGEIHHLRHWADGGTTDRANLAVLCRAHHWKAHEGGWKLLSTDAGFAAVAPVPDDLRRRRPDEPMDSDGVHSHGGGGYRRGRRPLIGEEEVDAAVALLQPLPEAQGAARRLLEGDYAERSLAAPPLSGARGPSGRCGAADDCSGDSARLEPP